MAQRARRRSRAVGCPYTITHLDIYIPDRCPVLGTPLEIGEGSLGPTSPSLDKIVPSLGYVPGNIAVISHRANVIKQNATSEELFAVARWLKAEEDRVRRELLGEAA